MFRANRNLMPVMVPAHDTANIARMSSCPSGTAPYQWLFPLGFLCGLLGVALWIPFGLWGGGAYPGAPHAELMILGFFLPVACGFLMTALPHFIGAASAASWEVAGVGLASLGIAGAAWSQHEVWAFGLAGLILLQMIGFALRRFRRTTQAVRPPFALLFTGLLAGLLGTALLAGRAVWPIAPAILGTARSLVLYGMPLAIILGVGSDIIPLFLGMSAPPQPMRRAGQRRGSNRPALFRFAGYGLLLASSFLADVSGNVPFGWWVRSSVATFVMLREWRLLRFMSGGYFAWGLRCSAWTTLCGVWGMALFPTAALLAAHLFFIGGIALLIFTVATRVILAHGGYDLRLERRSWAVLALLIGMLLALLTRLWAPHSRNYMAHLAYAALVWCAAVGCWSVVFARKIFVRADHS